MALARPVVRVVAGLIGIPVRRAGLLLGLVGFLLGLVGGVLRPIGLLLGHVGPVLRLSGRGPGLGGALPRLLLLLLAGPAAGHFGGFSRHVGGLLRHHGRLVRLLGPLPDLLGPQPGLLGPQPGLLEPQPRLLRALMRAEPGRACAASLAVSGGFGLAGLALDRVPGHAVGFPGLGHALAGGELSRLVLSHDHFFPRRVGPRLPAMDEGHDQSPPR
jgi:hypothetical protein